MQLSGTNKAGFRFDWFLPAKYSWFVDFWHCFPTIDVSARLKSTLLCCATGSETDSVAGGTTVSVTHLYTRPCTANVMGNNVARPLHMSLLKRLNRRSGEHERFPSRRGCEAIKSAELAQLYHHTILNNRECSRWHSRVQAVAFLPVRETRR